jgi:hypothetical protein
MLRGLAIFAVLFVAQAPTTVSPVKGQTKPLSTPKQRVAKAGSSQNGSNQATSQDSKQASPDTVLPTPQPSAPGCDETCQQGRQNLDIQRKLEWFTGGLVIVGFLQARTMVWQGVFLRRTWVEIHSQAHLLKRQADLLERQTDAAAKSAAAFINKERSRVFIRAEITGDFCATFYAVNRGQSPARITYGFVDCEIFGNEDKFSEVPDYTRGDPARVFGQNEWVLPKGESRIGNYDADYVSATQNPDLFASVMSGKETVWFYGVVRYTDSVSENEHEVRFCYETGIRNDKSLYILPRGPDAYRQET